MPLAFRIGDKYKMSAESRWILLGKDGKPHPRLLYYYKFLFYIWKTLSFEKKISQLINYEKKPDDILWKYKDRYLPQQIKKMISKAIILSKIPSVLIVKYENLSGNNGRELQLETMKNINSYLNLNLIDHDYEFLLDNLFGNKLILSRTFKDGRSYKWKQMMSVSLNKKIWRFYGKDLLELGYERPNF